MRNDSSRNRPKKRGALLGALAVAALLLGACSSGGGSMAADNESSVEVGGEEATQSADRSVIVEGFVSIVVDDVAQAVESSEALVAGADGRIDGRDERIEEHGDERVSVATLILRIPVARLDGVLDDLREVGDVESLETSSIDVTDAVQDTAARIASLEATILRLQTFQDQAANVDELLTIEGQISDRRDELEGLQARQKADQERIALSTLTLTIRSFTEVPTNPGSFWEGLVIGWNALVGFGAGFVVVLGVLLPWLVLLALIAGVVAVLVRVLKRRRARRPQPQPPASSPLPPTWIGTPYGVDPYPGGQASPVQTPQTAPSELHTERPPQA